MKFNLVHTTMTSAFALMLLAGGANLAMAQDESQIASDNASTSASNVAGRDVSAGNTSSTTEESFNTRSDSTTAESFNTRSDTDNSSETTESFNTRSDTDNSSETTESFNTRSDTDNSSETTESFNTRSESATVESFNTRSDSSTTNEEAFNTTNSFNTDASVKAEAQSSGDAGAAGNDLNWVSQVNEQNLSGSVSGNFEAGGGGRDIITGDLFGGSGNYSHFAGVNNQNLNSGFLSVGQNASSINANGAVTMQ